MFHISKVENRKPQGVKLCASARGDGVHRCEFTEGKLELGDALVILFAVNRQVLHARRRLEERRNLMVTTRSWSTANTTFNAKEDECCPW